MILLRYKSKTFFMALGGFMGDAMTVKKARAFNGWYVPMNMFTQLPGHV
jgi:hypothetical protein